MVKKALILAAGFGTRLRPLTYHCPKPLVLVANRPLLHYHLRTLRALGVEKVVINLHHLSHLIKEQIGDGDKWGMELHYSLEEPDILGTGGGLAKVREFFEDEDHFLIINSDVLHDIDLRKAIQHHVQHKAVATMITRPHPNDKKLSWIGVDADQWVRYVPGHPPTDSLTQRLFTGMHVMTPKIFEYLTAGQFGCIIRTGYRAMLDANLPVASYLDVAGEFQEIGTPDAYWRANMRPPFGLHPSVSEVAQDSVVLGSLTPPYLIGHNVIIEKDVQIGPYVVIGDGAHIGHNSRIQHSVVWSGVRLQAGTKLEGGIAFADQYIRL